MEELIKLVSDRTGLPPDKAQLAVAGCGREGHGETAWHRVTPGRESRVWWLPSYKVSFTTPP